MKDRERFDSRSEADQAATRIWLAALPPCVTPASMELCAYLILQPCHQFAGVPE
jgi:hypothetical protein